MDSHLAGFFSRLAGARLNPVTPVVRAISCEFSVATRQAEGSGQAVGLTRESRGCYTRERSLLCRFQQRVAAALQQAIACRV
jgi:hypothetical protein